MNVEIITVLLPIMTFLGTSITLVIKLLNRSKIEVLLEDKFKRKLYDFIGFLLVAIVMATSISVISMYDIKLSRKMEDILLLVLLLCLIVLTVAIIFLPIAFSIYVFKLNKGNVAPRLFKMIKYSNIILFLILLYINLTVIYIIDKNNGNLEQIVVFIITFSILYLSIFLLANYINAQSNKKSRERYQVSIIQEGINKELAKLFYLYALGKEKLIFVEKKDSNRDNLNELTVFYVFDTSNALLMKYELFKEE